MVRRAALACVLLCAGTAGAPRASASSWSETRYGTRDGLPSPYVKGVAEDGAGFVWLATDGGLVRFDGSTFTSYLDAPSGRFVKAVASLPDGRVLVAGDSGVSVVSATARGARIEQLAPAGERAGASVLHYPKGLFVDSRGRAWVSELESVSLLQGGSRFERFAFPPEARSTSFVRSFSLAEDDRGRIWAAARSGELFALDEAARRFAAVPMPAHAPLLGNTNHLAAVAHDVLWQACDSGLVELRLAPDRAAAVSSRALDGFGVPSWIRPLGGEVLVTSYGGPARRVRPGEPAAPVAVSSASVIQQALVARSGDLYLSTDDGLVVLRRRPFEAVPLPPGQVASAESFALGPGGVLYACDRRSVYRLDRSGTSLRATRVLDLPGAQLMGLLGDGQRIAVAGLGRLLLIEGNRVTRSLDLRDRGTYVVGLAAAGDGSVWVAQFDAQGVLRLMPDGTLKTYAAAAGLPGRTSALRFAHDGTLYAAGAGRGSYLFRYDPASDAFLNVSQPPAFAVPEPFDVRDVEIDAQGRIWLASTAGLLEHAKGALRRVDLGPELTGLQTHSLARTPDGRLWVATSAGLVGYAPDRRGYETYDESAGLPAKTLGFHGLFAATGEILVATTTGAIARASLEDLATSPPGPPLLVQLRANGAELDFAGPGVLEVPHGAWLAARAASPGGGERVFQWKLEPVDGDWRPPSTRPEVVLATGGRGEHRLLVRAAVRGSNAWGPPAQLRLRVAAAWYQRWWAIAGFASVFALVFAGGALIARRTTLHNERRLERLVDERTGDLRQANAQLAASNAELERFAYTVSHDLKSPLVTIRGFLGFLVPAARAGDLDRLQGDVARVGQAAERMALLLDQLLELSRVGRTRNPPVRVPFAEIVREAARLAEGPLHARGVSLEIAEELPLVEGDRVRLVELVQNLLENAAKFSGDAPRPRVEVGARQSPSGPVLFVRDEGIGVDPSHHERIFGLFQKLDPRSAGTGLGLAIARRIAETHGGRLWVESEGRGRGSSFCFTLPCPGDAEAG